MSNTYHAIMKETPMKKKRRTLAECPLILTRARPSAVSPPAMVVMSCNILKPDSTQNNEDIVSLGLTAMTYQSLNKPA